jgi:hypothetical protein
MSILFQRYATTIRAISSRLKYYHKYYFIAYAVVTLTKLMVPTIDSDYVLYYYPKVILKHLF